MREDPILGDLNPEQREAVEHGGGVIVVLAGPGSGKTRVITRRVAMLADRRDVPAERILAVTFTNKAAQEMRDRVTRTLGEERGSLPTISTFHSACVRILRRHGRSVGIPRAFSILDTNDTKKILRSVLSDHGMPNEPAQVKEAQSAISRYKNGTGDGSDVGPVLEAYMERCRLLGAVDFDDLLLLTRRALEGHEEVRDDCRRRWSHLLVDEYQDTNPTQARLVQLLADPEDPQVCVVGDADQSIYGFRNASPRAFDDLLTTWPHATIVRLDRNYRSSPQIVELCRGLLDGEQDDERLRMSIRSEREDGPRPQLVHLKDDREEAKHVVDSIQARRRRSAILTRTNAQTRVLEEELARRRIPYQTVGTLRYYDRAEVKDALSWLRAAMNRKDLVALERAVGSVPQGIGRVTLDELLDTVRAGGDLTQVAENLRGARAEAVRRLDSLLNHIRDQAELGPEAAVTAMLEKTGLLEHNAKMENGQEKAENLEELKAAAAGGPASIEGTEIFLQEILLASEDGGDAHADILIMTAHAAKGREFPDVYVCGVEDGLFPHSNAGKDAESVREELRLLYVACSRPEERLMLCAAGRRFLHGETREQQPSPFLERIEHLMDVRRSAAGDYSIRSARPAGPGEREAAERRMQARHRPAAPRVGPRITEKQATIGTTVRHTKFGEGTITGTHPGHAPDVTVTFKDGTSRRLRLDLAPLELTEDA